MNRNPRSLWKSWNSAGGTNIQVTWMNEGLENTTISKRLFKGIKTEKFPNI